MDTMDVTDGMDKLNSVLGANRPSNVHKVHIVHRFPEAPVRSLVYLEKLLREGNLHP